MLSLSHRTRGGVAEKGTEGLNFKDPDGDGTLTNVSLRFPGQYYDAESGLVYNGDNYYDPKTGRWITADKMSVVEHVQRWKATMGMPNQPPLEINPYVRVLNNPLRWNDRTGNAAEGAAIGGAIGSVIGGVIGGVGGGAACTVVAPGVGTVACGGGGAVQGALEGAAIGAIIGSKIEDMCKKNDREKNCQALKNSILATCASLTGRKKFDCFAAAQESYRQCMED